jgi:DNA-binding NarL/FixJ family response regulator
LEAAHRRHIDSQGITEMRSFHSRERGALAPSVVHKPIQIDASLAARAAPASGPATIGVIEKRAFFRDCITQCLRVNSDLNVVSAASVEEWLEAAKTARASVVVLCADGKAGDEKTKRDLEALAQAPNALPVVVLSDFEGVEQIVDAIGKGARGYIPTNTSFAVAVEAMKMVNAGGTFVPASSLLAAHKLNDEAKEQQKPLETVFTARQASVVEALRLGKPNKTIAYELNMCESTVKVHVRNIMKRLKARNRTQVAYLAGELLMKAEGR